MRPIKIRLSFHRRFLWQQYKCKGKILYSEKSSRPFRLPSRLPNPSTVFGPLHDKFHLDSNYFPQNIRCVTLFALCACGGWCVCVWVVLYDNSFVLAKFIYLIPSESPPLTAYVCLTNKNYVKTCKYALSFDLWEPNGGGSPAHVCPLLIMITPPPKDIVTVKVLESLCGWQRSVAINWGACRWAQMKIDLPGPNWMGFFFLA